MGLKIKRVLAFAMTLTMLLGCFVFSTSADVTDPGAGTGTLIVSGYDKGQNGADSDGLSFSVYEDASGCHTMWFYKNEGTNGGWVRPLDQLKTSTTFAFWNCEFNGTVPDNFENTNASIKSWCKANVEKIVIYSGAKAFAGDVFKDYTALEYVEINATGCPSLAISRGNLFQNCTLKAIYQTGKQPVDGVADLTMIKEFGNSTHEPFNTMQGIHTILLGEEVKFCGKAIFYAVPSLKTVKIAATDASKITVDTSKITSSDKVTFNNNSVNPMIVCENEAVANKIATDVTKDATLVTYKEKDLTVVGAQTTTPSGTPETYNVRFMAVGASTEYDSVGFEVSAVRSGVTNYYTWNKSTTTVYNSISGTSKDGEFTKTASELLSGSSYVYTMTVTDIPTDIGAVTFLVRPYYISSGSTVYGYAQIITVGGTN